MIQALPEPRLAVFRFSVESVFSRHGYVTGQRPDEPWWKQRETCLLPAIAALNAVLFENRQGCRE